LPAYAENAAAKPGGVIIMADDMGFSDLGCYGGEIHTPNRDSLAANGLRFSQFYNAARCCPTRASLLTGLYPHQAGIGGMVSPGEALYWEHFGNRAVRAGSWKLVGTKKQWKLHNMENDRTETRDLAAGQPERVKQMAAMWEAWAARCDVVK